MEQGTVSGRVALLLRSTEVKPMFDRFVQLHVGLFHALCFRAGPMVLVVSTGACPKESGSGLEFLPPQHSLLMKE